MNWSGDYPLYEVLSQKSRRKNPLKSSLKVFSNTKSSGRYTVEGSNKEMSVEGRPGTLIYTLTDGLTRCSYRMSAEF